jgi:hypothetical protein
VPSLTKPVLWPPPHPTVLLEPEHRAVSVEVASWKTTVPLMPMLRARTSPFYFLHKVQFNVICKRGDTQSSSVQSHISAVLTAPASSAAGIPEGVRVEPEPQDDDHISNQAIWYLIFSSECKVSKSHWNQVTCIQSYFCFLVAR